MGVDGEGCHLKYLTLRSSVASSSLPWHQKHRSNIKARQGSQSRIVFSRLVPHYLTTYYVLPYVVPSSEPAQTTLKGGLGMWKLVGERSIPLICERRLCRGIILCGIVGAKDGGIAQWPSAFRLGTTGRQRMARAIDVSTKEISLPKPLQ